jgi:hypothetical protein
MHPLKWRYDCLDQPPAEHACGRSGGPSAEAGQVAE